MSVAPFEELDESALRARSSLKWERHGPDVLPLWVAEMDVMPPPEVIDVLTVAVRRGDMGYPASECGYAAAFGHFAARWGWGFETADTLTCVDVLTGIRALVEALVPVGGAVLVPVPVYPPFLSQPAETGRRVVTTPLDADGRLDVPAIEAALAATGARAILLCSPHNPTGTVHTRAELEALAAVAAAAGATVISDEVHAPLTFDHVTFTPWLSVDPAGVVVTSAAKAFNLAGLKAALIVAGPGARWVMRRLPESLGYGASHLGVIAHVAAWTSDPGWLSAVAANVVDNRAVLAALLADRLPAVRLRPAEATYLAWLDCTDLGLGDDPAAAFLGRGRVAVNSGPSFGPGGAGHVRLNLACSRAVLAQAVDRMART